jgi:hypothetical protein
VINKGIADMLNSYLYKKLHSLSCSLTSSSFSCLMKGSFEISVPTDNHMLSYKQCNTNMKIDRYLMAKERHTCVGIQDHLHYQYQNQATQATLPIAGHAKSLLVVAKSTNRTLSINSFSYYCTKNFVDYTQQNSESIEY